MESSPSKPPGRFKFKLRPFLLLGLMGLIIAQIVALSPSSLEQATKFASPDSFLSSETETLATGIPKGKVSEYGVDKFDYVSTINGKKEWKILAEKAFLYNAEKLVHLRKVTMYLYGSDEQITVVTSKEAKYFMGQRDLEAFGNVSTRFSDGFETHSEYMRYRPQLGKIDIPTSYGVTGGSNPEDLKPNEQRIAFRSMGLEFFMKQSEIILPKAAQLKMFRNGPKTENTLGVPDETTIESDRCLIDRNRQIAHFTMEANRPLDQRYVRITQPELFARSRRADLNYGDYSDLLQYMVAYEDVLIKEKILKTVSDNALRYGTGGQADFDTRSNVIVLTEYPQVYQDNDTITGDVIIVHRDTDIVEVEHSNAYNGGDNPTPKQPRPSPTVDPSPKASPR